MEKNPLNNNCPKFVPVDQKPLKKIIENRVNYNNLLERKKETENFLLSSLASNKNTPSANKIKTWVSQDKKRFIYDGFDLDLSYITPRIIAMGLPSTKIEGLFRNSMDDVKKFLNERHPNNYKVYNLCEEKKYPGNVFYKQAEFPFRDHEAPPLNLILPFCKDAASFMNEDPKNIIAIHCLAGKGRTGTLISCLMYYLNYFDSATESLQYYGMMRVENGRGVTVPSQIRYVYYFESVLKYKLPQPIFDYLPVTITKIKMFTAPPFSSIGSYCCPNFIIENGKTTFRWNDKNKTKDGYPELTQFVEFEIPDGGFIVKGDVRIYFEHVHSIGKNDMMFKLWFNTIFVPENGIMFFPKELIDKACKDTSCKKFKDKFGLEIQCKF